MITKILEAYQTSVEIPGGYVSAVVVHYNDPDGGKQQVLMFVVGDDIEIDKDGTGRTTVKLLSIPAVEVVDNQPHQVA